MRIRFKFKANDEKNDFKIFSLEGKPNMNSSDYDIRLDEARLVSISPDEYIRRCSKLMGVSVERLIASRLNDDYSFEIIEKAAKNETLSIPMIDWDNNFQDGIHRAMWCKDNGYDKIPVRIYGTPKR